MEIPRGRRVSKAHFLKKRMVLKRNFQRGWVLKLKHLPWEGYGYFVEQHILALCTDAFIKREDCRQGISMAFLMLIIDNYA